MWLVVGLGNPGKKYERNRHNIGFLAADALAGKLGANGWSRKFQGEVCEARHVNRDTVYLLKPQTFMNLSGDSVAAAARFYKIPVERIIVLQDELDLVPGKLRVKQGGGAGGHNGIKSIDAHLGEGYWRVRIGIGHPGDRDRVSEYVLSDFSKAEWEVQERMLDAVVGHFGLLLDSDMAGFMNKVTREMAPLESLAAPILTFPRKGGRDTAQPGDLQGKGPKVEDFSREGDSLSQRLASLPPLRGKVRMGGGHDLIPLARNLRKTMTDAERKLWHHLRRENLSGCKFRRQQPLGPYIVDFICLEKKLILEVDGSRHGDTAAQDAERTRYLEQTGHKVLRFWNNEVLENMDGVLQGINSTLQEQ